MKRKSYELTAGEKFGAVMSALCRSIGLQGVANAIDSNFEMKMLEERLEAREQRLSNENRVRATPGSEIKR